MSESTLDDILESMSTNTNYVTILDDNTLLFNAPIESESADALISSTYKLDAILECQKEPIRIVFSTPGGSIDEAMRIINMLRYGLRRPVHIYASGYVFSAGVFILAALENRFAFPYAFFLVHQVRLQVNDYLSTRHLDESRERLSIIENTMNKILFNIRAFTKSELEEKIAKSSDYIFSTEEALSRNIIKKIVNSAIFDKKSECVEKLKEKDEE